MSLKIYSYTIVKEWYQIKKKKWQITTQKGQSPKIFYKNKKVPKKITSSKNKNKLSCISPKKSKEKKNRKKERQC